MSRRTDPSNWMWTQAWDLLEEAERLHRRFFHLTGAASSEASWEPPADVFEDEREIVVVVAMPGVAADRVQVVNESGMLIVRGARPLPFAGSGYAVRQLELPYGVFERRIALPKGRFEVGAPEIALGCLVLRLQKTGT
ncbi:MAG TPA: Hsp20/alpha crystallin family protein [Casimicrobiaceae bacterium]